MHVFPYLPPTLRKHGRLCMRMLWQKCSVSRSHFDLNLGQSKNAKYMWDILHLEDVTCLSIQSKISSKVDA